MAKLEPINRMAYMNDMRILHEMILDLEEKTLNLEDKMDYLIDKISQYTVEQLDRTRDIKLPASEEKHK